MPVDAAQDLLLNPIRLRMIGAVACGKRTAGEIGEALPDVPAATLYRHLKKLADAGVLAVVATRPARGAVERVYALGQAPAGGPRTGAEPLWLSDDELETIREGIEDAIRPARAYGPAPWRKRRVLAWVVLPAEGS